MFPRKPRGVQGSNDTVSMWHMSQGEKGSESRDFYMAQIYGRPPTTDNPTPAKNILTLG